MMIKPKFDPKRWKGCSEQQQTAIRLVIEDQCSIQIIARAGCGKTFTLMQIVEAIVELGLGSVALMAYNKKIADELAEKLKQKGIDWRDALAATVHSYGMRAWRKIAKNVLVDERKVRDIIEEMGRYEEGDSVFRTCKDAIGKMVSLGKQRAIGYYGSIDDFELWADIWQHFGIDNEVPDKTPMFEVIHAAQKVYRHSLNLCKNIVDFDDMILAPLYFKAKFPTTPWVLVDECQDTNPARRALALAMMAPGGRMISVGDDRQAIYGFTGADADSMHQIAVATNAKIIPLNVTFRCPLAVVRLAQQIVPDFTPHESAKEGLVSEMSYEDFMKDELTKTLTKKDVILCRNTAPLVTMAYTLLAKGIPCNIEGRDIGESMIKLAQRWAIKTLNDLETRLQDYEERMVRQFTEKNQENRIGGFVDQLDCVRVIIDRCRSQKKHRIDDLVEEIKRMFSTTKDGESPDVLKLSTVHKSKGREWPRVFLVGKEKFMPNPYAKKDWEKVQEANLEYVADTRAQEHLCFVTAPPEKERKK